MHAVVTGGQRLGRAALRVMTVALATLTLALAGAPAAPAAVRAAPPGAPATQDARLAQLLRHDPVYVSDQLPRAVPRSWQPRFAALARRTGVPTYLLVLPARTSRDDSLLAGVHDRLGRPGLYVMLDGDGDLRAVSFGVDADASDAQTVATFGSPYDVSPLRLFQTFVDTVREAPAKAAAQADAVEARLDEQSDPGGERLVPSRYISWEDRDNQSFTTGAALLGVPLFVLLFGLWAVRLTRRRRGPAPHSPVVTPAAGPDREPRGKGRTGAGSAPGRPARRRRPGVPATAVVVAAAALATAIGLAAPHVFDQEFDGTPVHPTHADLTARIDRVAAGLTGHQVYLDPESRSPFTGAQLTRLEHRIASFTPGAVYVAAVPLDGSDESAGDPDAFLTALHRAVGKPGVYTVADTADGRLGVDVWGLPLEPGTVPEPITDPPVDGTAGQGFPQRYDQLLTFLDDLPHTSGTRPDAYDVTPEPLDDHRLASIWSDEFGDGLSAAGTGVVLLFLAAVGCAALVRRLRGRYRTGTAPDPADEPARPGAGHLRRAARHAVDELAAGLAGADHGGAARHAAAYACLDAALLLVDRDPDGRIDDGTAPADLVAAIVLARAGREELAGRPVERVCEVNPLHGLAAGRRTSRRNPRRTWLCPSCTAASQGPGGALQERRLRLPAHRGTTPYDEAPGVLPHVTGGIAVLIAKVKEDAHVR